MILVVLVTVPQEEAKTLAKILLEKRLSACVNIIKGLESFFWWQGKIDTEKESLLIIKTTNSAFGALKKAIVENHSYEVPEIIAFCVDKLNQEYQQWLEKEVHV